MDAENASLGDERRARPEEYGQRNSESRGFAGFGSNGFDSAEGSNGAANRPESVPDRGYTWTPAPPSTPHQNPQNTGGSTALDPFAAWNTPGVIGDAPGVRTMSPVEHEPNSRFTTPPTDDPPYIPDDAPETAALPTRSAKTGGSHQADSAAMPRISQPGEPLSALSSSPRTSLPTRGRPEAQRSDELTVPSGGAAQLSGAATTQPSTAEQNETSASGTPLPPAGDPATYRSTPTETDSFAGSSAETGSLPSWLSSIGEEPVPQALESGGRRRKPVLTEPAESDADSFNPFEDQHRAEESGESGTHSGDPYELPTAAQDSVGGHEPARSGLPSRSPRGQAAAPASSTDDDSAPPALPARRLPRSAARHAPAEIEDAPASGNAEAATPDTAAAEAPRTAPKPLALEADPAADLPAPRRMPRSASRYKPESEPAADAESDSADVFRSVAPVDDTESDDRGSDSPPETEVPPRLAPPADSTPILDRLLEPEPAHSTESDDDSAAAPVSAILTRILESENDTAGSRHSEPSAPPEPETAEAAADPQPASRRAPAAPLTLVPDEPHPAPEALTSGEESRPPLETRRSRRAREAAEAAPEPSTAEPATAALAEPARGPVPADTASRHSRSEEGTDIDINLIMRLLTASDDLEVLAGQAETGEVSATEVVRAAREARSAVLSAVTAWYGGPAQMVKFANALLQAARES